MNKGMCLLVLFTFFLNGCVLWDKNRNPTGSAIIFKENREFEKIDLPSLLTSNEDSAGSIEKAFNLFYYSDGTTSKTDSVLYRDRNRVQYRIIATSNQVCTNFKRALYRNESDSNFLLGLATTVFAGAGAVLAHEQTAKEFAAVAGVASGARSEFNSSYFRNITIEVISEGIDTARETIKKEIEQKNNKSIEQYTVEAAVADAIAYHNACNVIVGLQAAANALAEKKLTIQRGEDVGLVSLARVREQTLGLRNSPPEDLVESVEKYNQLNLEGLLAALEKVNTKIQGHSMAVNDSTPSDGSPKGTLKMKIEAGITSANTDVMKLKVQVKMTRFDLVAQKQELENRIKLSDGSPGVVKFKSDVAMAQVLENELAAKLMSLNDLLKEIEGFIS